MEKYLFRPDNCFFGDCMPFYNSQEGLFYLYFQKDTRNPVPFGDPFGWELATTSDFVNYRRYGEVLKRGTETANDQFIYAGSVYKDQKGKIQAIYTGFNRNFIEQDKPSQVLMRASSNDGINWQKNGIAIDLIPQSGYDSNNWRDPNLVWDEEREEYFLILGTRLKTNEKEKSGRLVYYVSKDGEKWSFKGDFWAPNLYTMIEMPQLFKEKNWWYLVYSEYDLEKTTHYAMSKNIMGPWILPAQDTFNGRAYYAARTASNGNDRFLFGWVPSKEAGKDENNYLWGGTFLPLRVLISENGELKTTLPMSLKSAVKDQVKFIPQEISTPYKRSEISYHKKLSGRSYLLTNKFKYKKGTRSFSVIFFENPQTKVGYEFNIDFNKQELSVRRTPNLHWYQMMNIGLTRQINLKPDTQYQFSVLIDETIAVFEIAGVCLSCRIEKCGTNSLSLAVVDGTVKIA